MQGNPISNVNIFLFESFGALAVPFGCSFIVLRLKNYTHYYSFLPGVLPPLSVPHYSPQEHVTHALQSRVPPNLIQHVADGLIFRAKNDQCCRWPAIVAFKCSRHKINCRLHQFVKERRGLVDLCILRGCFFLGADGAGGSFTSLI